MSNKVKPKPKVLTPEQAEAADVNLPPAGDARREVLAERKDELDKFMEEYMKDQIQIDPSKIEPDREILFHTHQDHLEVKNPEPGYHYCWVKRGLPGESSSLDLVKQRLLETITVGGKTMPMWEVVNNKHKREMYTKEGEALCNIGPCGERIIGDVLLMRTKTEYYEAWVKHEEAKRDRFTFGKTYNGLSGSKGLQYGTTDGGGDFAPLNENTLKHLMAQEMAKNRMSRMIKDGTMPGMAVPR